MATDQEAYRIVFSATAYHEEAPEKVGLHSILIMTQALAEEAEYWQRPADNSIEILHTIADCQT